MFCTLPTGWEEPWALTRGPLLQSRMRAYHLKMKRLVGVRHKVKAKIKGAVKGKVKKRARLEVREAVRKRMPDTKKLKDMMKKVLDRASEKVEEVDPTTPEPPRPATRRVTSASN
jgi:hypothetical protein